MASRRIRRERTRLPRRIDHGAHRTAQQPARPSRYQVPREFCRDLYPSLACLKDRLHRRGTIYRAPTAGNQERFLTSFGMTGPKLRFGSGRLRCMRLGFLRQLREARSIVYGDIRQHLAVDGHARGLQPVNQLPVAQPVLPGRRADALNPQPTVLPLLHAAVALRITVRTIRRFLCRLVKPALGEEEALGPLEILLAPSPALSAAFYAWHGFTPSIKWETKRVAVKREAKPRAGASSNGFVSGVFRFAVAFLWHSHSWLCSSAPRTGRTAGRHPCSAAWLVFVSAEFSAGQTLHTRRSRQFAEMGRRIAAPLQTYAP